MSEPSHLALAARVEAAIEQGGLEEARRLIEDAERRLGPRPELDELRRRLGVVESAISDGGQVEAAIRRAREETSRANYPSALAALQGALKIAPQDPALRQILEQTTKAALRHEAAVERNRAVVQTVERVGALIDREDLETAATELREANLRFGKHKTLLALQERLDALAQEAELERTVAFVDQARAFLDGGRWQDAFQQAERILRLDPKNREASEVKGLARAEIEREEAQRQAAWEIDQASQDVDRLIRAAELPRAARSLQQAVDRLGRHEVFDELARRLDQAKAELQAKKRLEWTQRRLKEAEDLVRQAARLSLQGRYDQAIERLHQARELHPQHPEIEDVLQAAQTARQRTLAERRRAEAVQAAETEIRQLLDGLHLEEAEKRLRTLVSRFGDEYPQFQVLSTRLERLREAESAGAALPGGAAGDQRAEAEALAHQQALATAYSWKQTLLFPFRGGGIAAFWGLLVLVVALEILADLARVGPVFRILRLLVPLAATAWTLAIVRETLRGRNTLPSWDDLLDPRGRGLDLALFVGIAGGAILPLLSLVFTRGWHALFGGAAGWWLAAFLGWGAAMAVVIVTGASGAFGQGQAPRLGRHVRAFQAGEADALRAANLLFSAVTTVVIVRAVFLPFLPWMGSPLAGALEVYTLLAVPHVVGVVVRRHRIELARIYC